MVYAPMIQRAYFHDHRLISPRHFIRFLGLNLP